jgi:hypothetical protein
MAAMKPRAERPEAEPESDGRTGTAGSDKEQRVTGVDLPRKPESGIEGGSRRSNGLKEATGGTPKELAGTTTLALRPGNGRMWRTSERQLRGVSFERKENVEERRCVEARLANVVSRSKSGKLELSGRQFQLSVIYAHLKD